MQVKEWTKRIIIFVCVCVPRNKVVYIIITHIQNTFPTGMIFLRSQSAPLDLGGHFAHCKLRRGMIHKRKEVLTW